MSDPDLILDARQRDSLAAGELCITTEPVPGSPVPRMTLWNLNILFDPGGKT